MDMDEISDMDGEILEKLAQHFPGTDQIIIFPKNGSEELKKHCLDLKRKAKGEKERCR
jgi:hypothetical protein